LELGDKFSSRNLEVSLPAFIFFEGDNTSDYYDGLGGVVGIQGNEHAFCSGRNCYAEVKFKSLDCTISGFGIESKSVNIYPTRSATLSIGRTVESLDYKIWNSLGNAEVVASPPVEVDSPIQSRYKSKAKKTQIE